MLETIKRTDKQFQKVQDMHIDTTLLDSNKIQSEPELDMEESASVATPEPQRGNLSINLSAPFIVSKKRVLDTPDSTDDVEDVANTDLFDIDEFGLLEFESVQEENIVPDDDDISDFSVSDIVADIEVAESIYDDSTWQDAPVEEYAEPFINDEAPELLDDNIEQEFTPSQEELYPFGQPVATEYTYVDYTSMAIAPTEDDMSDLFDMDEPEQYVDDSLFDYDDDPALLNEPDNTFGTAIENYITDTSDDVFAPDVYRHDILDPDVDGYELFDMDVYDDRQNDNSEYEPAEPTDLAIHSEDDFFLFDLDDDDDVIVQDDYGYSEQELFDTDFADFSDEQFGEAVMDAQYAFDNFEDADPISDLLVPDSEFAEDDVIIAMSSILEYIKMENGIYNVTPQPIFALEVVDYIDADEVAVPESATPSDDFDFGDDLFDIADEILSDAIIDDNQEKTVGQIVQEIKRSLGYDEDSADDDSFSANESDSVDDMFDFGDSELFQDLEKTMGKRGSELAYAYKIDGQEVPSYIPPLTPDSIILDTLSCYPYELGICIIGREEYGRFTKSQEEITSDNLFSDSASIDNQNWTSTILSEIPVKALFACDDPDIKHVIAISPSCISEVGIACLDALLENGAVMLLNTSDYIARDYNAVFVDASDLNNAVGERANFESQVKLLSLQNIFDEHALNAPLVKDAIVKTTEGAFSEDCISLIERAAADEDKDSRTMLFANSIFLRNKNAATLSDASDDNYQMAHSLVYLAAHLLEGDRLSKSNHISEQHVNMVANLLRIKSYESYFKPLAEGKPLEELLNQ